MWTMEASFALVPAELLLLSLVQWTRDFHTWFPWGMGACHLHPLQETCSPLNTDKLRLTVFSQHGISLLVCQALFLPATFTEAVNSSCQVWAASRLSPAWLPVHYVPPQPLIQLLKRHCPLEALPPRLCRQPCKNPLPRWRIRQPQGICYLYKLDAWITMIVTFSDGLQLRAKVTRQVSSAHLWPWHLPLSWSWVQRCSGWPHLLLPSSWCPNQAGGLAGSCRVWHRHPNSTYTNPSNPHRHDLKAFCWSCWKFDAILCCVPLCNTQNISSVNSQA